MTTTPSDDANRIGRHCLVSGRVQGVAYRAATRARAERLGVTGSARNLPDGRVEVYAFGPEVSVATLCAWLREGPPAARVAAVHCEPIAYEAHDRFRTG
jgi:acylphosphatase